MEIRYIFTYQPVTATVDCELPIYGTLTGNIFTRIQEHAQGIEVTQIMLTPSGKKIETRIHKRNRKGLFLQAAALDVFSIQRMERIEPKTFDLWMGES